MTIQELKTKILKTNCFEDNEYLNKYCELVINNLDNKKEKYKTATHHIIPRCYFKLNSLPIDNNKENLVVLNHANHLVAHFYLYKSAKEKLIKKGMAGALILMCNTDLQSINWEFINDFKDEYSHIVEFYYIECNSQNGKVRTLATRQLMSQSALKSENKRRLGCKDSKETCDKKSKAMQGKQCHLGYKDSEETKERKSKAFKNTFYVTNGVEDHRIKIEQENYYLSKGFKRGRSFGYKGSNPAIICIETNEIFNNLSDINKKYPNYNKGTIYTALTGRMKTAYGLHWKYLTKEEELKVLNNSNDNQD